MLWVRDGECVFAIDDGLVSYGSVSKCQHESA